MQFACYSQRAKWCGTTSVARIKRRNAILALRLAKRHGPVTVALKSIRLLLTGGKMMRSEDWYSPPPLLLLLYHRSILQFPLILHDLQVSFAYQTDAARHVGPLCFPIVHSLWLGPALMTYMWKKCDDIYVEDVWWICGRRVMTYMWKTCEEPFIMVHSNQLVWCQWLGPSRLWMIAPWLHSLLALSILWWGAGLRKCTCLMPCLDAH